MAQIDQIVNVNISRQTTAVEMVAFDIPLILVEMSADDEVTFTDRVRTYTSLEAVAGDLPETHKGYIIASKLLGGDIKPSTFKIGKKRVGESYVQAIREIQEVDDTWYALITDTHEDANINSISEYIQGTRKLYVTSTSSPEAFQQSQSVVYTTKISFQGLGVAEDGDTLTVRISGKNYTVEYDEDTSSWGSLTPIDGGLFLGTAGVLGDVMTIESSDTAFVVTKASQELSNTAAYSGELDPSAISLNDPVGMDIGQRLNKKLMFRTAILWSATADSEYPEAAWVGPQIVEVPGSNTWEYKRLVGTTVSRLSDSQITILEDRGYNYYIPVKGVNITRRGKLLDKDWIDTLIVVDWLHARLQEQIFYRLTNTRKIPYTDPGLTVIENEIRSVFAQAIENGAIDTYSLVVPKVLSIPENVRAQRRVETITFDARLQGAVSVVVIRGVVHP